MARKKPALNVTRRARAFAGRFLESTSGNAAMIFGLVAVTVIMAGGAAVDVARAVAMKTRLSSALDAAALAVGTQLNMTEEELDAMAQKYFDANYPVAALGTTEDVVLDQNGEKISLSVIGHVDTTLLRIININQFDLNVTNEVTRSANNIEVALVLDVTNSMKGQRLTDLKVAANDMVDMIVQDVQTPYYTKMAIIPYAQAVNVGTYAASVRGAVVGPKTITGAAWQTGAVLDINNITRANPGVVTTATAHGLANGDKIWIHSVSNMSQVTNKPYIVFLDGTTTTTTFKLKRYDGVLLDTSGYSSYNASANDKVRKCVVPTVGVNGCEVQVTSNGHGFVNGARVVINSVAGMTQINNDTTDSDDADDDADNDATGERATWYVSESTANTFVLRGSMPSGTSSGSLYSNYTSAGSIYCTTQGCEYYRFTNEESPSQKRVFQISTCVSERTTNAFDDTAPSTTPMGRVYPSYGTNACLTPTITPLSAVKTTLHTEVNALAACGSTGGHLGIGWGWYLLTPTPNFGYLWPAASVPAAYGEDHLFKIMILMTDGEYNSSYCNGVISQDSTTGSGSSSDHINCDAPNEHAYDQANALCAAMKASPKNVIVYTVGFDVVSSVNAQNLVADCATDAEHAYYPNTGAELKTAFQLIAQEISQLRLSQ
jgi:Flp pilus assembly protein TadG